MPRQNRSIKNKPFFATAGLGFTLGETPAERATTEHRMDAFCAVYQNLTGKKVVFEYLIYAESPPLVQQHPSSKPLTLSWTSERRPEPRTSSELPRTLSTLSTPSSSAGRQTCFEKFTNNPPLKNSV